MIVCKNLNPSDTINSVADWFTKAPPAQGIKHWVDGRSAKETARYWVSTIPREFSDLLKVLQIDCELCSPEYVSHFDNLPRNGRNHDLLILAKDKSEGKVVISVESKVDEEFDKTAGDCNTEIAAKKARGENSNADERIKLIKQALFKDRNKGNIDKLRYQLLTAVAGTLSEAKKQGAKKAVFVVQTFLSSLMNSKKHRQNQRDLDYFLEIFTDGQHKIIHDGDLFGPFRVPGNEFIPDDVELWIGKYSVRI